MKRFVLILMTVCVLLFSACGKDNEENLTETAEKTITLSPLSSAELGRAEKLTEPDFVLNEENLLASIADFFGGSCALDFYLEDEDGRVYRCDKEALNRRFGEVFCDAEYKVISMRKYDAAVAYGSVEDPYWEASYLRAYFANAAGQISVIIGRDGTYLDFYRAVEKENEMNESGRTFFTETDIFDELLAVKEEILPYCSLPE